MAPFYGLGSTASRLQPLRGSSLLFTIQFPEIPGTHITHFNNNIVLPLFVFETLGFMFSVFFLQFKQYDFIFYTYMYLLF